MCVPVIPPYSMLPSIPTASAGCGTAEALTCWYISLMCFWVQITTYYSALASGYSFAMVIAPWGCLGMHGWTLSTCELCTPTGVCLQYSTGAPIILYPALSYRFWSYRTRVASCGGNLQLMDSCCVLIRLLHGFYRAYKWSSRNGSTHTSQWSLVCSLLLPISLETGLTNAVVAILNP